MNGAWRQRVPHSMREAPAYLPVNPASGRTWPPPGWTPQGLLAHQERHRAVVALLHLHASGAAGVRDGLLAREMEVEHRTTELDVRERELAQFGRTLGERAQAMQEATTELLALPWVAAADTAPVPAQRRGA